MLGPIGLVTTGLIGLYSITKMINAAREKERQKLEAFSDVITVSTDKLKFLSEQFNFVPVKGSLESFGKDLERTSVVVRSAREELKASEGFQQTYGQNIDQVRGMSDQQAQTALSFMGLDLISQGMAREQVQLLIDTIKEEAGKKDLKFDFKSITFDEKGMKGLNSQFDVSIKEFATTAQNGFEKVFQQVGVGVGRGTRIQIVEKLVPNAEAKAAIKNAGALVGSYAESLNRLATSGSIGLEDLTKITDTMFASIAKAAPDASMQIRIFNATLNAIDPALSKAVKGVKDLKDMQLLLKAAIAGVSANLIASAALAFRTADALNKVAAANLRAFGVQDLTADQARARGVADGRAVDFRILLNKEMEKELALAKELNKVQGTISGSGDGTKKEDSPFALAVKQLQNQQKELKNTTTAYNMLKKAGFDSATALEYAKDSVIALGLATGTIKTDQLEKIKTLMIDIEKRSSSAAIRDFLTSLRNENTLKESFSGIIPSLLAMGATFEDIETIVNNPTLMNAFVDKSVTAEDRTRRIKEYLDAIRTGEAIDININLQTPEGIQKEFDKRKSAAMEYYDVLEREIQDRFEEPIKAAEKAAADAADNVKKIQDEIDGLQKTITTKQRNIEETINRPIEELQQSINDLQRKIEMEFDRPLGLLQDESSRLSEDLTIMDKAAEGINAKYDAQAAALEKVSEINQDIIGQQKQQIGLADALTQGDISAAANAAQEMRASRAEAASRGAGNIIQAARDAELGALRSPSGLTRDQIAQRQYEIDRQSFALTSQRKLVENEILINQDKIYALEQKRIPLVAEIRGIEDNILSIQNGRLATAQSAQIAADLALETRRKELQTELDTIDAQRERWEDAQLAIDMAKVKGKEFQDQLIVSEGVAKGIADKWNSIQSKDIVLRITEIRTVIINEVKGTTVKKAFGGKIKKMASGGVVPGTGLIDKVPALLTPGEFVINKESAKTFGPLLNKINESKFPSFLNAGYSQEKYNAEPSLVISAPSRTSVNTISDNSNTVYNYSVGITVGGSSATPDTIAKAVLGEIKYIDSQRIRGQR
jgi:hypothetical protein